MSDPNWLSEDEMRVWRAFISTSSALSTAMDASLQKSNGLKLDDFEVLVHLSEADDHRLRMSELSDRHLHSKSRLSQRIDRLEKRGLVAREKCADDARGTWATLTRNGMRKLEGAAPAHLEHVREFFFDHIESTDLPALINSLENVAEQLRNQST